MNVTLRFSANQTNEMPQPAQLPAPLPLSAPAEFPTQTPHSTELIESLFRVMIHNDDVTPFDYVMAILGKVFMLSEEIAEHVAMTAHSEGVAIVIIKPKGEAEKMSQLANRSARHDGYPLTFSTEPDL